MSPENRIPANSQPPLKSAPNSDLASVLLNDPELAKKAAEINDQIMGDLLPDSFIKKSEIENPDNFQQLREIPPSFFNESDPNHPTQKIASDPTYDLATDPLFQDEEPVKAKPKHPARNRQTGRIHAHNGHPGAQSKISKLRAGRPNRLRAYKFPFELQYAKAEIDPALEPQAKKLGTNYLVYKELGRGGMGQVFLAKHTNLKRLCVIKSIIPQMASSKASARFFKEAQITSQLDHPGIVKVYDFQITPSLYYVMEFLEGVSMQTIIKKFTEINIARNIPEQNQEKQFLPEYIATQWLLQTCEALKYMHKQGVIHRDIKPSNLMIDPENNIRICDFGISQAMESKTTTDNLDVSQMSIEQTCGTVGTPGYAPLEQLNKEKNITPAADIFALGATFYELLTGELPYPGDTIMNILAKMMEGGNYHPPLVNEKNHLISDKFAQIIDKMIAKNLNQRYKSVSQVIRDLTELRELHAKGLLKYHLEKHPYLAGGGVLGVITVLSLAIGSVLNRSTEPPNRQPQNQRKQSPDWNEEDLRLKQSALDLWEEVKRQVPHLAPAEKLPQLLEMITHAKNQISEAANFNPTYEPQEAAITMDYYLIAGLVFYRRFKPVDGQPPAFNPNDVSLEVLRTNRQAVETAQTSFNNAATIFPEAFQSHFQLRWYQAISYANIEWLLDLEINQLTQQRNTMRSTLNDHTLEEERNRIISQMALLRTQIDSLIQQRFSNINQAISHFTELNRNLEQILATESPNTINCNRVRILEQLAQRYHRQALLTATSSHGHNLQEARQQIAQALQHYTQAIATFDLLSPEEQGNPGRKSDLMSNQAYANSAYASSISPFITNPAEIEIEVTPFYTEAKNIWRKTILQRAQENQGKSEEIPNFYWTEYINNLKTPRAQAIKTLQDTVRINHNEHNAQRILQSLLPSSPSPDNGKFGEDQPLPPSPPNHQKQRKQR